MSKQRLWGTSVKGNVYSLDTSASEWGQVRNQYNVLQGFKKVIASPTGAWALGCDHQIYIYVEKLDVPIRCQVSTYENERWLPTQGWSGRHLVSAVDPFDWSSEDGTVHLPAGDFRLPSRGWEWEGDWRLDLNVQGFSTDKDGWRYSNIGFQSGFSHKKTFRSCVRRRRWIRYQRYAATDMWAKLASLHVDPLEEPIVDVAVGGYSLPNLEEGAASVWIITIQAKIVLRLGVNHKKPEGTSWVHVDLTGGEEKDLVSISAGPTHLVWVVTCLGAILARTGITWRNTKGTDWVQIPVPEGLGERDRIVQVSVGHNCAWVVSQDGKVWLRKGVSDADRHGTGWLQMVDRMKMITVIGQDKVMGIDKDDRQLYFRMGISHDEMSGRSWQLVDLPFTTITKNPSGSISSDISSLTDEGIMVDGDFIAEREIESQDANEKSISSHNCAKTIPELTLNVLPNEQKAKSSENQSKYMQGDNQNTPDITRQICNASKGTPVDNKSPSTLSGVQSPGSHSDMFLSMGLANDFGGLELNLEVKEEEDQMNDGREGFGHLTIDMDQDRTQQPLCATGSAENTDLNSSLKEDNPSIVWDENVVAAKDLEEKPQKFVSFNRFRTNFGNRFKGPVEVINKLKTTSPKKMFKDLRSDLQDGKKEVLGVISQAQEVFKHGKQDKEIDQIKVSFKKGEEEENMELKFYDDQSKDTPVEGGGEEAIKESAEVESEDKNTEKSSCPLDDIPPFQGQNSRSPSFSTSESGAFLDDALGHMTLLQLPPERDVGEIQWAWVSGCFTQNLDETRLRHWFHSDKGRVSGVCIFTR